MFKFTRTLKIITFLILSLLLGIFLYYFNTSHPVTFNPQGGTSYVRYENAKIIKVVKEELENEKDNPIEGIRRGTQELEVKILTGEHKGVTKTITNHLTYTHNIYGKAGEKIIVTVDTADSKTYDVAVYSHYRASTLYSLIFLFFIGLCIIGGKKGFKSVLGLIFTFICIIFLFLPMLYRGYSPIFSAVIIVILVTSVSLFLLNGWSTKTSSAVLGTILGVIIAGIISSIVGNLVHLTGFNSEEADILVVIAGESGMKIKGLLFAGVLISSLGAVMDISMSIASSIYEIYVSNRKLTKKELFTSGINIGRDMMGTMANTLILAFTGSSLITLIMLYSYNIPYRQLINMDMISTEVLQSMCGSIAIILTVPLVAFICSRIIPYYLEKGEDIPPRC